MKKFWTLCFLLPLAAFGQTGTPSIVSRVGAILAEGTRGSTQGLYLKQVGGAVYAEQQAGFVFDPAGATAVAPLLYALGRAQIGAVTLETAVPRLTNGAAGCPNPPVENGTEPLSTALREMMWHSDNSRAHAVQSSLGRTTIDAFLRTLGLPVLTLPQTPGCQTPARGTIAELAAIYEAVAGSSILTTHKPTFYSLLPGKSQATAESSDYDHLWDTDVPAMIAAEAPAGVTQLQIAQFRNSMDLGYKSGAAAACQQADCGSVIESFSIAGWAKIPYCAGGQTTGREFVFGAFIAGAPDLGWTPGKLTAARKAFTAARGELLREQIRDGLASCYGTDAVLVTPAPGSVLAGRTVPFVWSSAANSSGYRLDIGRTQGGAELGTLFTSAANAVVTNLPCDGGVVYARLWTRTETYGSPKDYAFRACRNGGPVITSPAPGTAIASSSVAFTWSAVTDADQYRLSVGTTLGGNDLGAIDTTATSATVNNVPRDRIVFVRITAHTPAGTTVPNDFAYNNTAGQTPVIISVVNAATLQPNLSPGCLAIVNATSFSADAVVGVNGVRAQLAGTPGPSQISFIVPLNTPEGFANVQIASGNSVSPGVSVRISPASPGLFPLLDESGAALPSTRRLVPGDVLTGRAVGLGPISSDGRPTLGMRVLVGGVSATLLSVGPLASSPGIVQFTFRVPDSAPSGLQSTTVQVGQFSSNPAPVLIAGPAVNGVLNAANFATGAKVAPGSLVSLFGTDLAGEDKYGVFPSVLLPGGGVITVNGVTAPLFDVVPSGGQINFLVPFETPANGSVPVVVTNAMGTSAAFQLAMGPAAPGIFRIGDPSNSKRFNAAALLANTAWRVMPSSMAAALGIPQDCKVNRVNVASICGEPASAGDGIQLYVTGLGRATANGNPVGNQLRTGDVAPANGNPLYRTVDTPRVTIGGIDATVLFSGIAPGFAGLYQINVTIPGGVAPGDDVPVTVTIGDVSDTATIAIR